MYGPSALFCSCLLALSVGASRLPFPLSANAVTRVRWQAETIQSRIRAQIAEIPMSPRIVIDAPEAIPDVPIRGLASIAEALSMFEEVLRSMSQTQLRVDVENLRGYVEGQMRALACPAKPASSENTLEGFLSVSVPYGMTAGLVALDRLQEYISRLLLNLDKLRTC